MPKAISIVVLLHLVAAQETPLDECRNGTWLLSLLIPGMVAKRADRITNYKYDVAASQLTDNGNAEPL